MPHITTDDGVKLAYEEAGSGTPVVFVHEFAGDMASWEPQLRTFGQRYRAIAYNARGYQPSDVPPTPASYSQDRARQDILAVLDGLGLEKAHVVGLSMGGFATLHFGIHHGDRALSLTVAGCGYGAEPDKRAQFRAEANATADLIEEKGMEAFADTYSLGPTRVQFQNKNPRAWQEFRDQLAAHSAQGSANTMRGVQAERPSLFDLKEQMAGITTPTLVLTGDEDWPCLMPGVMMKETIPTAALVMMANCGHTINIEEPDEFNAILLDFLAQVDAGRWQARDPRAVSSSILGVKKD
ncbi:MAG TPA: alpha/beta hydrolase [Alphaproteobacteria bacterium]|nr:alpha/beta hydrolase [Alphaproteobacteria bacterium]